jgi:uncharacterized protein involved in outer membrane biogenesis
MKRLFKWLAITIVVLLVLVVVAPIVAINVIDQSVIKGEIGARVEAATGRTLTIEGDIVPTTYPWLGAEVADVTLGNATGFTAPHFARIKRASVQVKLIPLLSGDIEMGTVALDGVDVNLERNAKGVTNWDDLTQLGGGEDSGAGGDAATGALALGGVELSGGSATWIDAGVGQRIELRDINLTTGGVNLAKIEIPLDLRFAFDANQPGMSGAASLKATVAQGADSETWTAQGSEFELNVSGPAISGGSVAMKLTGDVGFSGSKQSVQLTNVTLDASKVALAQLSGAFNVAVTSANIDLASGSAETSGLKITAPQFTSGDLKGSVTFDAALKYDGPSGTLALSDLKALTNVGGGALGDKPTEIQTKAKSLNVNTKTMDVEMDALTSTIAKFEHDGMTGNVTTTTSLRYQGKTGDVQASALHVAGKLSGGPIGKGSLPFVFKGPLRFDAKAGRVLVPGMALALEKFNVDETRGTLRASGDASFEVAKLRFRSPNLKVSGDLSGRPLRGGKSKVAIKTAVDARVADGRFSFAGATLELRNLVTQGIKGNVTLKGSLAGNTKTKLWTVKGGKVTTKLTGKTLPKGKLAARLDANVVVNLAEQKIDVETFSVRALDVKVLGRVKVTGLDKAPIVAGNIDVKTFDLRRLLSRIGEKAPKTAAANALRKVSLKTNFSGALSGAGPRARLSDIVLTVDATKVRGSLNADRIPTGLIKFDLRANGINVDSYLPPKSRKQAATPGAAAAAAATLPMDLLRSLHFSGKLKVGKLTLANIRASAVNVTAKAKSGKIKLHPVSARLYKGGYKGNIALDATGKVVRVTVDEKLTKVSLEHLLRDVTGAAPVGGIGSVTAKLTTSGRNPEQLVAGLNGDVKVVMRNGSIKSIDIVRSVCSALSGSKQAGETQFDLLTANGKVTNGVVDNPDMNIASPALRIRMAGKVDLPRNRLDYLGQVGLVQSCTGQGGKSRQDLSGIDIPIKARGPFDNVKVEVDIEKLLTQGLSSKLGKVLEKKLGDKLGGKIGSSLLKGILGN